MDKLKKIFNIPLWSVICLFFAIMFAAVLIAEDLLLANEIWVNNYLKINPYSKVTDGDEGDLRYYKSDFETTGENGETIYDHEAMRAHSMQTALDVATDGSVLLWNNGGALPLGSGAKISFFGGASVDYLHHGTGSGLVPITYYDTVKSSCEKEEYGLKVNPVLWDAYLNSGYARGVKAGINGDQNYTSFMVNEVAYSKIESAVNQSISGYSDAAVMIIARTGGENGDTFFSTTECLDENYMDLSNTEKQVLDKLVALKQSNQVKKVILLINSGSAMQFKNISKYAENFDVDACMWVGMGGLVSPDQIAALLSGKKSPYGRLTATYVYDNDSAPAAENFGDFTFTEYEGVPATETYAHSTKYVAYAENIYVGYRYYETRYEDAVLGQGNASSAPGAKMNSVWSYGDEVIYPFGYGASYTEFEYSGFNAVKNKDGDYEVSVTVKNVGSVKGREVVQVYLQKPYTDYDKENGIEKSAVELVGFAKTGELAPSGQPGDSETVKITVDAYEFKSYDAYGAGTYILEKGEYFISAGNTAHSALNNILAAKGKTVADGMDEEGNSDFVCRIEIEKDDFSKYSVSPFTGVEITNRFDDADINLYKGTKNQGITYLSRSDWKNTYPTAVTLTCTDPDMINDMQYGPYVPQNETDEMPVFGEITSSLGLITLPMLMDLKYDDPIWEDFLNQITWEDANVLVTAGANNHSAVGLDEDAQLIIPSMLVDDGPCGIRQSSTILCGTNMAFPCNGLLSATWDLDKVEELGDAFGMEIMHAGYTGIWGTGANVYRTAYSGRNWEYFSEDGYLSGKMNSAETVGLMNRGIVVFTKHFALNDQERNRCGGTVWANEQSIREIYLKAFEAGITEAHANGVMSSLTRIGCVWAGRHVGLLTNVLRGEWGFIGICETDAKVGGYQWNGNAKALAITAGQDLWLGSSSKKAFDGFKDNATVCKAIRESCHRILYTRLHSNAMNGVSTNTRIVYNTPWWRTVITATQVLSGILMGLSLAAATTAVVLKIKTNKNKEINHEQKD